MKKPFWVLENIDATTRRYLFTLWDINWLATRYAWLSVPIYFTAGLTIAALLGELSIQPQLWLSGIFYGLLFYSTNIMHTLGHILSGHLVRQPMQANLLTATFDVNIYTGEQSGYPRRVHLGRALGGPILNLTAGLISLVLGRSTDWSWLVILGYMQLASGLWTLLPIAPMDGWVILRHSRTKSPSIRQGQ
jgi:Zn-dependent protease